MDWGHLLLVVAPRTILRRIFLMAAMDDYHYMYRGRMLFKAPLTAAGEAWLKNLKEGAPFYLPLKATLDLLGGLMLITGLYAPLGLLLLLPVITIVILFQFSINRVGLPMGVIMLVTTLLLLFAYADHYKPLLQS